MSATEAGTGAGGLRFSRPMTVIAAAMVGVMVVVTAIEEVAYGWKRANRATASWWRHVEHRQRRRMFNLELDYVLRRLPFR
jgi:hypothetical protein